MALVLSAILYSAGLAVVAGGVSLIRPLRWVGVSTRKRALVLILAGFVGGAVAVFWPSPTLRIERATTAMDDVIPAFQFVERHETPVGAAPAKVFGSIRPVTAAEIRFFRLLTWIRNPRIRAEQESIMAAPAEKPLLDVALGSGFRLVKEVPDREIVISARIAPAVTAVMNFVVVPDGRGGSVLSTETRVRADTDASARAFAVYWRAIYPGSALIRIEWLRAIKRRAEIQSSGND
jgi:hypothetical protein